MKNVLIILMVIFNVALYASHEDRGNMLRISTYNIWNPIFEEKYSGDNTWEQRRSAVIQNILFSKSDLICMQEVGEEAYQNIAQDSQIKSQYMSLYLSHAPSQLNQPEGRDGLAFFYKPEKAVILQIKQSEAGSRPTHRRDFYVDIWVNQPGYCARIACTHLDSGPDLEIGNLQLSNLVKDVQADCEEVDFIALCGDFNEGENESVRPRSEIMRKAGFVNDGSTAPTRPEAIKVRHNGHVDWIYFKKKSGLRFSLIPLPPIGDEKASDHKLTTTDIVIQD